jgi:PIN domain nuclease of toxin-antitoxin system
VAVWLYQKSLDLMSRKAKALMEKEEIAISPISRLEIEYLYEIKKIKINSVELLTYLQNRIGLNIDEIDLNPLIEIALTETWTRDPFDRIIVSHARLRNVALITRDQLILKHYHRAMA